MVNLFVNGIEVQVKANTTVLQACDGVGVEIPRFCYHERLLVAGNCRMCLVEIVGAPKPVASCAMPVAPGMKVLTDTERVKKARESVMEFRLLNHPLDCPICDQGGECDLQDQSMVYGSDRSRRAEPKRGVEDKYLGPIVKTVMTRCIHCTRCIRFASEVAGVADLGTSARGNATEVGTYVDKVLKTERSGNLVDLCPVGALTAKPGAFRFRPWELTSVDSVDGLDGTGASIRVQWRGNAVMRVLPRPNDEINGEWLGDKSRYAMDGRASNRLLKSYVYEKARRHHRKEVNAETILAAFHRDFHTLVTEGKEGIQVVLSPTIDRRVAQAFFQRTRAFAAAGQGDRFHLSVLGGDGHGTGIAALGLGVGIAARKDADVCLRRGVNPRTEAPLINAKRREGFLQGNRELVTRGNALSLTMPSQHVPGDLASILAARGQDGEDRSGLLAKRRNASRPVRLRGAGLSLRKDARARQGLLSSLVDLIQSHGKMQPNWTRLNRLHAHTNGMGMERLEIPGFDGWKKGLQPVYVGTSESERKEFGYRASFQTDLRRALVTHGDTKLPEAGRLMPNTAYTESTDVYANTEGRLASTQGVEEEKARKWGVMNHANWCREAEGREAEASLNSSHRLDVSAFLPDRVRGRDQNPVRCPSAQDWVVKGLPGLTTARATEVVPRLHDYYREGHPLARHSVTMAKCSMELGPKHCFDQ
jgi:NADH-quinone oxidoreductase chain G